jgi:hypothetical protein
MPLGAPAFFHTLRSALNMGYYATEGANGAIALSERIFTEAGKAKIVVNLQYHGDAFAIKLDAVNKRGNHEPLFHFFDDTSRPWARRCDFIVLHLSGKRINAYCLEFKWKTLSSDSITSQLNASVAWCYVALSALKHYTGQHKRLHLAKFVVSRHPNAAPFLDDTGKYLRGDHTVRHYPYDEIEGMDLEALDNQSVEVIG